FSEGVVREVVGRLIAQYEEGAVAPEAFLRGDFGEEPQRLVAEVLTERHAVSERAQEKGLRRVSLDERPYEAANGAMKELKLDRVREAIEAVNRKIFVAQQAGEDLLELNKE